MGVAAMRFGCHFRNRALKLPEESRIFPHLHTSLLDVAGMLEAKGCTNSISAFQHKGRQKNIFEVPCAVPEAQLGQRIASGARRQERAHPAGGSLRTWVYIR